MKFMRYKSFIYKHLNKYIVKKMLAFANIFYNTLINTAPFDAYVPITAPTSDIIILLKL